MSFDVYYGSVEKLSAFRPKSPEFDSDQGHVLRLQVPPQPEPVWVHARKQKEYKGISKVMMQSKMLPRSSCFINFKLEVKKIQRDFKDEPRSIKDNGGSLNSLPHNAKLLSGSNLHSFRRVTLTLQTSRVLSSKSLSDY